MNIPCSRCDRPVIAKGLCASHYGSQRISDLRAAARTAVRACRNCQREFVGKDRGRRAIYCSRECNDAGQNRAKRARLLAARPERRCVECDTPLPVEKHGQAIVCSTLCSWKHQNRLSATRRRVERRSHRKPCPQCGKDLSPDLRANAIYCSPECKKREMDARWRANSPDYMRGYLYKLTPERFAEMVAEQDNRCAICRTDTPGGQGGWHVDHDHATNAIRGLLCNACNLGLGRFQDDPARLRAAIAYLESRPA